MRQRRRRQLEPIEHDDADAVGTLAEIEAELEPEERERSLGAYRVAKNLAAVGVQAAGYVEREHVRGTAVDRSDGFHRDTGHRPRQADAEDRVDDYVGAVQAVRLPGTRGTAGRDKIVV